MLVTSRATQPVALWAAGFVVLVACTPKNDVPPAKPGPIAAEPNPGGGQNPPQNARAQSQASSFQTQNLGPVESGRHRPLGPNYAQAKVDSETVALLNLDARIRAAKRQSRTKPARRRLLVQLYLLRARILGTMEDLDEAQAAIRPLFSKLHEPTAASFVTRAIFRDAIHQYEGALADLAQARRLGGNPTAIRQHEQAVEMARGNWTEALASRSQAVKVSPTQANFNRYASALLAGGKYGEAEAAFESAVKAHRTNVPFSVAWNHFARGLMWAEHVGDSRRGAQHYREALRYLPQYAVANIHLSELDAEDGKIELAIERLSKLKRATDPEVFAKLGDFHALAKRTREASTFYEQAKQRYESLLVRYPEAFAEHAAEFYLGGGADPQRALTLAELNLQVKRTDRAFALKLECLEALERKRARCALAESLNQRAVSHSRLEQALKKARKICNLTRRQVD